MTKLFCGIDPGITTGIAYLWEGLDGELRAAVDWVVVDDGDDWWDLMVWAGWEVAQRVFDMKVDAVGFDGDLVVAMEDFLLRPGGGSGGRGGGRNIISPVAIGAAIWGRFIESDESDGSDESEGSEGSEGSGSGRIVRKTFMPSAKNSVGAGKFNRVWKLVDGGGRGGGLHVKDAMRHAILGMREDGRG